MIKVLFVCHGNICRSPMAMFLLRDMVKKRGLSDRFRIDSAATSTEELGNPLYEPARRELTRHGVPCEGHVVRVLQRADYARYDLLIGAESVNIRNMLRISPDPEGKMRLLLSRDIGRRASALDSPDNAGTSVQSIFQHIADSALAAANATDEKVYRDAVELLRQCTMVHLVAMGNTTSLCQDMGPRLERMGIRCTYDPDYPRYAEIFKSTRSDASWSTPTACVLTKDSLSSYAHPAVSPDGQWLYFVSDMPGGEGGLDIWRVRITADDNFGGVENLGAPINTPGDEMFPTFRPNGDLYFSSNGHPGMGGLDVWCAKQDSLKAWALNRLGYPLNSEGDDFGLTFEGIYNRGFFFFLLTVQGWVYEKDGYELPQALVYMVGNDGTNQKISVKGDGSFVVEVKPNVDYVLLGTCKGFLNHKQDFRADTAGVTKEYVLQFPLPSISRPVLIDNVLYEFDKADLTKESETELMALVTLLNENPNITIELGAHCDYRGDEKYNLWLSQKRAESCVNFLIKNGIAKERLTPVGYGVTKPKTVSKKMLESFDFLKEGDVLSKEFIENLPNEQQEICNSLNRRTEFRVLRTTYNMFEK